MAAAKKKPIIRWTYYFGKKKIQTGPFKGGVKPGFIAMAPKMASALGLRLNLPKDIPGTTYSVKNGVIYDTHPVKGGKTVSQPVKGTIGSKKVRLVVKTIDAKATRDNGASVSGTGKTAKVKGSKGTSLTEATTQVLVLGVPAWAAIDDMQAFLKGSKVISFSMGGEQHPVIGGR
jgi:hypothetical protein